MTTETALAGGLKSAMEGDAMRTNQVRELWNSQQLYIISLRPLNHSGPAAMFDMQDSEPPLHVPATKTS